MRHLKHGRKLGRNATHRVALMRNLARALIQHGRITTTVETRIVGKASLSVAFSSVSLIENSQPISGGDSE